jgi:hypothetical protein
VQPPEQSTHRSVVLQSVPFAFPVQLVMGVAVLVGFAVCVGVGVAFGLVVAVGGGGVGVLGQPELGMHWRLPGQLTATPEQLPP